MTDRSELDDVTADRLLEGGLAPDDAPPGYQDVAATLRAAALMAADAPTHGAEAAAAAFRDAIPARRTLKMKKWKIAAATLAGGLTLSTGLAAADVLPNGAQHAASTALSHMGIHVSDPDDSTDVTTVKGDDDGTEVENEHTSTSVEHPDNHGKDVSSVARDDSTTGADHGSAVCATASDNKCQPDDHGQAGEDHPSSTVTTPEHPTGDDNPGTEHNHGGSSNSESGSDNSGSGDSGSD